MRDLAARPANYGIIGATAHFDFDRFPPKGYELIARRSRIGHGRARYEAAVAGLRTWRVQRLSGIEVDVQPTTDRTTYRPVGFEGKDPARAASTEAQQVFAADGEPFLQPGDSAMQRIRLGPVQIHAPIRVIAVEDEATTHAVIFGTLEGHPESGEERMLVELAEDESVFFHLRVLAKPHAWWARLGGPVARRVQRRYHERYLDALRRIRVD
ncbi:DUF1990 family protein [Agrococcus sp. SGAir0287]|uniref:DUF1990 family protein n=1 Tax=Agrococcus sp. SGAir0287 TaxID=2070347 RepID=UPI0010F953AE|nr:DUF1990 domain-containing protein [Agrococcus sp. SGAir0287]